MKRSSVISALAVFLTLVSSAWGSGDFSRDVTVDFGKNQTGTISNGGQQISLSLNQSSGAGFTSKNEFLFGRFDMQIKLAPANSPSTVTRFYLSSPAGKTHDEINFEFLGNSSGQPYTLQTDVYSQGNGNREQKFQLWFDPTESFHSYSIVWNPKNIIFMVDNMAIRVFANRESIGVPFPTKRPMRLYCTISDREGEPFTASFQNMNINACVAQFSGQACNQEWQPRNLDPTTRNLVRWAQQRTMIYNYCKDRVRFPRQRPRECRGLRF